SDLSGQYGIDPWQLGPQERGVDLPAAEGHTRARADRPADRRGEDSRADGAGGARQPRPADPERPGHTGLPQLQFHRGGTLPLDGRPAVDHIFPVLSAELFLKAERAFQFELNLPDASYIQFGYWDSLKKGLLAGEQLYLSLKQMEAAYLDLNVRGLEIS